MRRALLLFVVLISVSVAVAAAPPPAQTLQRATAAVGILDGRGFAGSYLLSVRVKVNAPGHDDDEDSLEVEEVTVHPDGSQTTRLVRAVANGRDVTADRAHKPHVESDRGQRHDEIDVEMLPLGSNASRFAFSPARVRDGVLVARFRPVSAGDDEDIFAEGELAWDPETLDPLWLELGPNENLPFVSKLFLRFDFARENGILYPSRVETMTRAGIPLLLRVKVNVLVEVSDLRPSSAVAMPAEASD